MFVYVPNLHVSRKVANILRTHQSTFAMILNWLLMVTHTIWRFTLGVKITSLLNWVFFHSSNPMLLLRLCYSIRRDFKRNLSEKYSHRNGRRGFLQWHTGFTSLNISVNMNCVASCMKVCAPVTVPWTVRPETQRGPLLWVSIFNHRENPHLIHRFPVSARLFFTRWQRDRYFLR